MATDSTQIADEKNIQSIKIKIVELLSNSTLSSGMYIEDLYQYLLNDITNSDKQQVSKT